MDDNTEGTSTDYGTDLIYELEGENAEEEEGFSYGETDIASVRTLYNSEDFISKAYLSENSTLSEDFFNFDFSFSFESVKRFNMCLLDMDTILHWSGSILHIFSVASKSTTFRRSCDAGIGFVTKHPFQNMFAVGEKGTYPYLILYEWPTFNIINVLKRGTKVGYSYLDFSPEGDMLASQGCEPDHMLTIWNWKKAWVILRCRAYTQDVYNTSFNKHFVGKLTSCGAGHIKFWTMADTFTGLKLQGKIGKFGKTPISDTACILGLPSGYTLSGNQTGNMLLWDACEIKLEVSRGKEPCHNGKITYLEYDPESGDLISIGTDGKYRVWDFTRIEKTRIKGDRKIVTALPSFEAEIRDYFGPSSINYVIKMSNDPSSPNFSNYVMQDIRGSLWKVNLDLSPDSAPAERILIRHSGPIVGMDTSPGEYYIASLGFGGKLLITNAAKRYILLIKQFPGNGSAMLWLPVSIDKTGTVIILGFTDGTLRVAVASIRAAELAHNEPHSSINLNWGKEYIITIQALKPHKFAIKSLACKQSTSLLASGSMDGTVFIYKCVPYHEHVQLEPVGLVSLLGPVYSLKWKKSEENDLICCLTNSTVVNVVFKNIHKMKVEDNYIGPTSTTITKFKSVKSEIERDYLLQSIAKKKKEKLEKKKARLAKMRQEDPGLIVDEEVFLRDSDEEPDLPPLFYPEEDCTIFFTRWVDGRYWLSPSGYDAGYVYLYNLGEDKPSAVIPVKDANNIEITVCETILDGEYTFLGLGNGKIRVVKAQKDNPLDFSDYLELQMHDFQHGRITRIRFSHDYKMVFTCGTDSNLFSYNLGLPESKLGPKKIMPPLMELPKYGIDGIIPEGETSLQEENAKAKMKALAGEAALLMEKKVKELETIGKKVDELWALNDILPPDKRLTVREMELHPFFAKTMLQELDEKFTSWEKKLRYDFEKAKLLYKKAYNYYIKPLKTLDVHLVGIRTGEEVKTFRVHELTKQFLEAESIIKMYCQERESIHRDDQKKAVHKKVSISFLDRRKTQKQSQLPMLEEGILKFVPLLNQQEKLLYEAFVKRRKERSALLEELADSRPEDPIDELPPNPLHKRGEGRKLKTDPAFKLSSSQRITKQLKLHHIIRSVRQVNSLKDDFNDKVMALRKYKMEEMIKFRDYYVLHKYVASELPPHYVQQLPEIPSINIRLEYPEVFYAAKDITLPIDEKWDESDEAVADLYERYCPGLGAKDNLMLEYLANSVQSSDLDEFCDIILKPRITRLRQLQKKMIHDINAFIDSFDSKLSALILEKIHYEHKVTYLELYLGTLCREMIVISKYQYLEEFTQDNINIYLAIKVIYKLKLFVRKRKITRKEFTIELYTEKMKSLFKEFQQMVAGNRYAKHLTKVYKKKYRPPKKTVEGESSTSSSSSESSSDDGGEDDDDLAPYKFDEKILPDGCDPEMFSRVFKLRETRHELEAKVVNHKKDIQSILHEMVGLKKVLKIDAVLLAIYQFQMERISKEKQNEINQINILVVMNSSQIQNWDAERKEYVHPEDLCVVSQGGIKDLREYRKHLHTMTDNLQQEKKRHSIHKVRLKKDIRHFESTQKEMMLKKKEKLIQKFGIETDFCALDLESMRRLLLSKTYDTVLKEKFGFIKHIKDKMYEEKEKLAALKKMHANNLFTMAAIEEEKYKTIQDEYKLKKTRRSLQEYISLDQLEMDIQNLICIRDQQMVIKQKLKSEIRHLKCKDRTAVPEIKFGKHEKQGEGDGKEKDKADEETLEEAEEENYDNFVLPGSDDESLQEAVMEFLKQSEGESEGVQPELSGQMEASYEEEVDELQIEEEDMQSELLAAMEESEEPEEVTEQKEDDAKESDKPIEENETEGNLEEPTDQDTTEEPLKEENVEGVEEKGTEAGETSAKEAVDDKNEVVEPADETVAENATQE